MKFGIVRFIIAIILLIVIIQVLTTIYFSSTHWPDEHVEIGNHHVGRLHKIRAHVDATQVSFWREHKLALLKIVLSFLSLKNMLSFACSYVKKLSLLAITSFRDSARKLIYAVIPPVSMIRAIFLIWFLYSKSMNIFNPIYIACQQKETWFELNLPGRRWVPSKSNPYSSHLWQICFCKAAIRV